MPGIGTAFRGEWALASAHLQSASFKHAGENRIIEEEKLLLMQFQSNVAIPKVISRLQERKR